MIMMRIAMEMGGTISTKFFDNVEWWLVEETLEHVGVPLRFVRFLESLVATRSCRFVTAHVVSRAFTPGSGLGHGRPLAALLAILSQQPLAFTLDAVCLGIHIRASEMRGPESIPGVRTTHVGYVDDMTCTPNPMTTLNRCFWSLEETFFVMGQLIEEWCTLTSSTLNASKCALLVWERDCQDPIPWVFKLAGRCLRPVRSAKLL